ncbi:hypothetical protein BDZ94DRAFT_1267479 [Collybia nuda]|uniref:Uncharacterized protein n=1 Tax=Collybia nuda TaxID=64659 RepID=A0A9P5XZN6_9AGAR|nr:hypothetical protein BDZ94DRAFT_1267479 [Collybia nuda]
MVILVTSVATKLEKCLKIRETWRRTFQNYHYYHHHHHYHHHYHQKPTSTIMNKTHTSRVAGVDPKMPTQTAPSSSQIVIPMRAYTVKDATKAIHQAYHDTEDKIVKALEQLPDNASDAQIQAVEDRIKEFVAELKRETDETLEALITPLSVLRGVKQEGIPKVIETPTTKDRVKTRVFLESDSEMSRSDSSRTSMVSTLNLPVPALESLPREASPSTSRLLHHSKGAPWAIPTPPNSSPERNEAFSKARHDQRRMETGTSKGKRPERQ